VLLLCLLILPACTLAPTPANLPPQRLYVFDVSHHHLDHYGHCLAVMAQPGPCTTDRPPPGKSYSELLRDYDTLILVSTLQGIVNRDRPRLYLIHDHQPARQGVDKFWLETYRQPGQPYGWLAETELVELHSLEELLNVFADALAGLVIWDPAVPATLNVATTIAGVENLAVLRQGSEIEAEVKPYLEVKRSLVGLFSPDGGHTTLPDSHTPSSGSAKADAYLWAKEKYLDTGRANPRFLAYLEDGWPAVRYSQQQMTRGGVYALERDYVVQQRGFAFDLSPWSDELPNDDPGQPLGADAATLKTVLEAAEARAGGLIKVWGFIPWYEKYAAPPGAGSARHSPVQGEWESTWLFSQHGAYLQGGGGDVFGAALANVSVHRFGPSPGQRPAPAAPLEETLREQDYLRPDGRVNPELTFVLFYAGDYDLAHPVYALLANHATAPWLDPRRGQVPLAWGLNPALVEELPAVLGYLYASQTDQDYFVAANSGAGYLNPDALSELALLRWLWRSRRFYAEYGYNIQGFLLNGNGAALSQRRLDAFSLLAPVGLLTPDFETDEPWPRRHLGVPLTAMQTETLADTPELAAEAIHAAYRRNLARYRPPFLAFRSSFLSATFLWGVRDRLQVHQAEGRITASDGTLLHPNYTVVDPYTFFFLLERWLEEQAG
jgi:hypothetical protein